MDLIVVRVWSLMQIIYDKKYKYRQSSRLAPSLLLLLFLFQIRNYSDSIVSAF